ncbi:hypothetical protein [Streptomyces sp. NPDC003023]|uniref:NACHT N-terminal helical domain 7-containing protein n=1 Tax=Streptomyces sp. NPDC003023 TaxID=3364675 RepID=UPI003687F3A0
MAGEHLIEAFCARLKEMVGGSPLTQAELAGRLGLAPASLSALLNGHRKSPPDWDTVRAVVTACHEAVPRPVRGPAGRQQPAEDLAYWRRRHSELEQDFDREISRAPAEQRVTAADLPEPDPPDPPKPPEPARCRVCGDAYASEFFSHGEAEYGNELGWEAATDILAGARRHLRSEAQSLLEWTVRSEAELTALRDEAAEATGALLEGLGDQVRQACHGHRVQLLRAAHVVLLAQGILLSEALDTMLRMSAVDMGLLMHDLLDDERVASAPMPVADVPYQDHRDRVTAHYCKVLGGEPHLGNTTSAAAEAATSLYEARLAALAAACPEVFIWVSMQDGPDAARLLAAVPDGAARARLEEFYRELREQRHGLDGLETLLRALARPSAPGSWPRRLSTLYRRELARPISPIGDDTGHAGPGPYLPRLSKGYVNPAFRTAVHGAGAKPHMVSWWRSRPLREDIQSFLAGHITGSPLVHRPLLILGDPGGGKSLLTRLLAARLPPSDYLPIRIELRNVQADEDVLGQIDQALRLTTLTQTNWATVTQSTDVLPVLIFDGFDELLQAGGRNHGNYLHDIAAFQRMSADNGRPVAAIVTSRTVVADQAQIPVSSVVIRLEPFDSERIDRWTDAWNDTNSGHFAAQGISPLDRDVTDAHPELTAQPLLLLMVAMYHAVDLAGRGSGDDEPVTGRRTPMSRAELYERLLGLFVRREVEKQGAGQPPAILEERVENELDLLSVVAFAIFNRGRQGVAAEEADHDLARLRAPGADTETPQARLLFGRFFFIHEAKATFGDSDRRWYEFLHATFGEYLIARKTARTVAHCPDHGQWDALLFALLSFAPLSDRAQILDDLRELLPSSAVVDRLFRESLRERLPEHRLDCTVGLDPVPVTRRHAYYSANLLLLALAMEKGESVPFSRLVGESADPVESWRTHATLWQSQFTSSAWDAFTLAVSARPMEVPGPDRRDIALRLGQHEGPATTPALNWTLNSPKIGPAAVYKDDRPALAALRRARLMHDTDTELALEPALPVFAELAALVDVVLVTADGVSAAHALVSLLIAEPRPLAAAAPVLHARYDSCLNVLRAVPAGVRERFVALLAGRLSQDSEHLPAEMVTGVLEKLRTAWGGDADEFEEATRITLAACALRLVDRAGADVARAAVDSAMFFAGVGLHYSHDVAPQRAGGPAGVSPEAGPPRPAEETWFRMLDLFLTGSWTDPPQPGPRATALRALRVALAAGLRDWCTRYAGGILDAVSGEDLAVLTPGERDHLYSLVPRPELEARLGQVPAGRRAVAPPGEADADVSSAPDRRR